jgi:hypothetical protein
MWDNKTSGGGWRPRVAGGGWECREAGEVSKGIYDFAHGCFPGLPAELQIALHSMWVERLTEKVPPQ